MTVKYRELSNDLHEKEPKKEWIYVYVQQIDFAVHQKLRQQSK